MYHLSWKCKQHYLVLYWRQEKHLQINLCLIKPLFKDTIIIPTALLNIYNHRK